MTITARRANEAINGKQNVEAVERVGARTPREMVKAINAKRWKRVLVICHSGTKAEWRDAIRMYSTIPNVRTYDITRNRDGYLPSANYTLVSRLIFRQVFNLQGHKGGPTWEALIVDYPRRKTERRGVVALFDELERNFSSTVPH